MPKNMMGLFLLLGLLGCAGLAVAQDAPGANPGGQVQKPAAAGKAPVAATTAAGNPEVKAAASAPEQTGGQKPAKASHPVQGSPAVMATEKRYQDYLDREKAASDSSLAKQRGKLEDKYKGFVRTAKPKQGSQSGAKKGAE